MRNEAPDLRGNSRALKSVRLVLTLVLVKEVALVTFPSLVLDGNLQARHESAVEMLSRLSGNLISVVNQAFEVGRSWMPFPVVLEIDLCQYHISLVLVAGHDMIVFQQRLDYSSVLSQCPYMPAWHLQKSSQMLYPMYFFHFEAMTVVVRAS